MQSIRPDKDVGYKEVQYSRPTSFYVWIDVVFALYTEFSPIYYLFFFRSVK